MDLWPQAMAALTIVFKSLLKLVSYRIIHVDLLQGQKQSVHCWKERRHNEFKRSLFQTDLLKKGTW